MGQFADPQLVLWHFPAACSQVAVCALEGAGLVYRLELVNLAKSEQTSPEYLAVNPLGKVPLLSIDGEPLSENAAILIYVSALRPDAGLFPNSADARVRAEIVGGMAFCGGTLHPNVRAFANPARLTAGETEPVRERGNQLLTKAFAHAEKRLSARNWWLGERSLIDVYLNWAFGVARNAGFPVEVYPNLDNLQQRLKEWPAFVRMLEVNAEATKALGL